MNNTTSLFCVRHENSTISMFGGRALDAGFIKLSEMLVVSITLSIFAFFCNKIMFLVCFFLRAKNG